VSKKSNRFLFVISLTFAAAALMAWHGFEPPLENNKFLSFPILIGEWKGENIPMPDYVYQGIETKYLFLRNYRSEKYDNPVNLSIVWFDDRNIAFHAPEACLGGVGITVQEKTTTKIEIGDKYYNIGRLIVDFKGSKDLVLYYFDVEGNITTNQSAIRLHVLARRLLFKRSSASFVRLITRINTTEEAAFEEIQNFLRIMFPMTAQFTYTDFINR
jgi:EpsI family protein